MSNVIDLSADEPQADAENQAPAENEAVVGSQQFTATRRPRRAVLSDITVALIISGLAADKGRGFNPYDNRMGGVPPDVWNRPHGRR